MPLLPDKSSKFRWKAPLLAFILYNIDNILDHFLLIAILGGDQIVLPINFLITGAFERMDFIHRMIEVPLMAYPYFHLALIVCCDFVLVYMDGANSCK